MRRWSAALLLGVVLVPVAVVAGQTVDVPARAMCIGCRISQQRIAQIAPPSDSLSFGLSTTAVLDSRGTLYVVPEESDRVVVYDSTGRFVRVFGRRGNGPGEFRNINRLAVGPGDTLFVFQYDMRFHVFNPGGQHVRTGTAAIIPQKVQVMRDGRFVVAADLPTQTLAGLPLHLLTSTGAIASSFGSRGAATNAGSPLQNMRAIAAPGAAGDVWVSWIDRYQLELWPAGANTPRRTLTRESSDFPSASNDPAKTLFSYSCSGGNFVAALRPPSAITDVSIDQAQRLWVAVAVAAEAWNQPVTGCTSGREGVPVLGPRELDAFFDSAIEVIDPSNGTVLIRSRFPTARFITLRHDLYLALTELQSGDNGLELWKLSALGLPVR